MVKRGSVPGRLSLGGVDSLPGSHSYGYLGVQIQVEQPADETVEELVQEYCTFDRRTRALGPKKFPHRLISRAVVPDKE